MSESEYRAMWKRCVKDREALAKRVEELEETVESLREALTTPYRVKHAEITRLREALEEIASNEARLAPHIEWVLRADITTQSGDKGE